MNAGVPHDIARGDTCYLSGKRNKQVWSPAGEGRVDPRGASSAAANRDKTTAHRRPHRQETCAR